MDKHTPLARAPGLHLFFAETGETNDRKLASRKNGILLWVAWLVLGALAVLFAARLDIGESATRNFYLVPSVAAWIVLGAVPFTLTWIWQKNKGKLIMAWAAWIALALLAPFSEVRTFLVVWTLFGIVPFALN